MIIRHDCTDQKLVKHTDGRKVISDDAIVYVYDFDSDTVNIYEHVIIYEFTNWLGETKPHADIGGRNKNVANRMPDKPGMAVWNKMFNSKGKVTYWQINENEPDALLDISEELHKAFDQLRNKKQKEIDRIEREIEKLNNIQKRFKQYAVKIDSTAY